jgi:hypothetical protein
MSILDNTKKVWGPPNQKQSNGKVVDDRPITLAVIGCGQRGEVSYFMVLMYGN